MKLAVVLLAVVTACQPGGEAPTTDLSGFDPDQAQRERQACVADGGAWSRVASTVFTCVRQTRDGGQACQAAGDCEGICLARSGTCAPLTPIFGCNEVLTENGRRVTLCRQ